MTEYTPQTHEALARFIAGSIDTIQRRDGATVGGAELTARAEWHRWLSELLATAQDRWQSEEDARLGRWRWPENPDYVVYPDQWPDTDAARIIRESDGATGSWPRPPEEVGDYDEADPEFAAVARAYFAAHPDRQPWHDARPGEVWAVTTKNVAEEVAVHVTQTREFQYNDGLRYGILDDRFVSARRIWPEATES